MSVKPVYTKLYMDSFDPVSGAPNLKCPSCKTIYTPKTQFTAAKSALTVEKADFNNLVDFVCPGCGSIIRLFTAVHKYPDGSLAYCCQKSSEEGAGGIQADWWVRPNR